MNIVRSLRRRIDKLLNDKTGNIAMLTGLIMIPMTFALGMGIDYALAKQTQVKLQGVADSAVLAALTPTELTKSDADAQAAVQNLWNVQAPSAINGVGVTGAATVQTNLSTGVRTSTITFTGQYPTMFGSVLGIKTLPLGSTSVAKNSLAPNINFYMLVDTSPSMALPTTTAGLTAMQNASGCAYACHEACPTCDNLNNPNGWDNYTYAITPTANGGLGLYLRIKNVQDAVTSMISQAASTAHANGVTYGLSISKFDYQVTQVYSTPDIYSNATAATTAVQNTATDANGEALGLYPLQIYKNNCVFQSNCNPSNAGSDRDTAIDAALGVMDTANTGSASNGPGWTMFTTPGYGILGGTPQEVLFIVSDGSEDTYFGGSRVYAPVSSPGISPKATNTDWCSQIKGQGIRIAFLYLTYVPITTDSWYTGHVQPVQYPNNVAITSANDQFAIAAQNCASTGLYTQVNTDGDITAALNALFAKVVATARLTH